MLQLSLTELTIVPKQASWLAAIARDANHAQDRERLTGEPTKLRESPRDFAACCAKCSLSCRGFSPATGLFTGRLGSGAPRNRWASTEAMEHTSLSMPPKVGVRRGVYVYLPQNYLLL